MKMRFLFLIFISLGLQAQTSLEWQRVSLEEKITDKVRHAVGGLVDNGKYLVEVSVELNDPGPPNFNDINKTGLKVSDIPFDESKGDYIAFSKVGLEVPVVEKYFQEHQQKLKEIHKFNETYNVFKSLKAVKVDVILSDLLPEEVFQNVQNTVNKLKLPTGTVKADIKFEKIKMEYQKPEAPKVVEEPKVPEMTMKDWIEWLAKFANAFGLIFATILFGLVGLKLLSKWHEYMTNLKALANINRDETMEEGKEEDQEQDSNEEDKSVEESLMVGLSEASAEENFDRFRKFFQTSKLETVLMIKRWINGQEGKSDYTFALRGVAQQLSDEELAEIFSGLNDLEREKWKNELNEFLKADEVVVANKTISEEVMRQMVGANRVKDLELIDTLLGLRSDVACRFVIERPEEGKILMNLLTPQFSGKILDQLEPSQVEKVLLHSMTFDFDQISDNFSAFKQSLNQFIDDVGGKRKPFNDKILQMLPNFNPSKEKMLYNFLAKDGLRDEMIKIATNCFPSDLIMDLPKDFIKTLMQNFPMNKKVQLLGSMQADKRDHFLEQFAEKGSATREMFDLEFENLVNDQGIIDRLQARHEEIWKDFVQYSRMMIKNDMELKGQLEMVISGWVDQLIKQEKSTRSSHSKLSLAA